MSEVKDGVYPFYVRDGKLYSIILSKEEKQMFDSFMLGFQQQTKKPLNILDKPLGDVYVEKSKEN